MKYLIFSIILAGCGTQDPANKGEYPFVSEETKAITPEIKEEITANNPPMAMTVSGEKPTCGPENENQLIYHVEDELFYSCKGNDWAVIDLKGKDGAKGEDGSDSIVRKTWTMKNRDDAYFSNDAGDGAGLYIPGNSQIILHSGNYVQLTANGTSFSLNIFGKINSENKAILTHVFNGDLSIKITIGFDENDQINFFQWERIINGASPYFVKRNDNIYVAD